MATAILPRPAATSAGELATIDQARAFAEAAQSPNTRKAYASDLRDFRSFCRTREVSWLPATPQTVALYVTDLAGCSKIATIRRRLVAIIQAHRERELDSPTSHEAVRRIVRGIARTNGTAQTKKAAVGVEQLRRMLLCTRGDDAKARRDRAMLLLGFAGALRRSELAELDVTDLSWMRAGLKIAIRRSKTDQTGEGAEIPVPFVADRALCAARAVREWLDVAGITQGPVFRTFTLDHAVTDRRIDGRDVANLVKRLALQARLDGDFSGHSLRAGFVTAAARSHVSLDRIAAVTRHRSLAILSGYIRRANLFEDPALTSIVTPRAPKGATAA
ncbi:MAG TPA: tyrosine-type recombinase/integrase [Candidatus Tumulicola sp.]|jgi:site-specific recombinase XerD